MQVRNEIMHGCVDPGEARLKLAEVKPLVDWEQAEIPILFYTPLASESAKNIKAPAVLTRKRRRPFSLEGNEEMTHDLGIGVASFSLPEDRICRAVDRKFVGDRRLSALHGEVSC